MTKVLKFKAGFHVEVVSWENDGDNYNTTSTHTETREMAMALRGLAQLCSTSHYNSKGTHIGNMYDEGFTEAQKTLVEDFMEANPILVHPEDYSRDKCLDWWAEWNYELMPCGEGYTTRVCESVTIYYYPTDVYVEVID